MDRSLGTLREKSNGPGIDDGREMGASMDSLEPPVPLLDPDEARHRAAQAQIPDALAELNVFRLLLNRPRLAKATADLLLSLLFGAQLEARLRELIIMRVAWITGSEYEWAQHWRIATQAGVSEADLVGVRAGVSHEGFGPQDRAVLKAVDEVGIGGAVSQTTLAELRRLLGEDAAIEAVAAVGAWAMVSTLLRSFDVPLEEGTPGWPPDGVDPSRTI